MQIQINAKLASDNHTTRATIAITDGNDIALDFAAEIADAIRRRGWELEVAYLPETDGPERNEQGLIADHPWTRSRPTLTNGEECATCDLPRLQHETVD